MSNFPVPQRPDVCWFVLELEGENLDALVHPRAGRNAIEASPTAVEERPIDDLKCTAVARCVLAALKTMHSHGWIHCDVKPANIVLTAPGAESCGQAYKLIDFGFALRIDVPGACGGAAAGAPGYVAPEMLGDRPRATYTADIYSLGVTMFELVTAKLPLVPARPLDSGPTSAPSTSCCLGYSSWHVRAGAGVTAEKGIATDVLERLSSGPLSSFDRNLAMVFAKALERRETDRYGLLREQGSGVCSCVGGNEAKLEMLGMMRKAGRLEGL